MTFWSQPRFLDGSTSSARETAPRYLMRGFSGASGQTMSGTGAFASVFFCFCAATGATSESAVIAITARRKSTVGVARVLISCPLVAAAAEVALAGLELEPLLGRSTVRVVAAEAGELLALGRRVGHARIRVV